MAENKAPAKRAAANTVPANPAAVVFPHSESGFTTVMRKEGLRSAGRIMTSETKLNQFLKELAILGAHAKARHAANVKAHEKKVEAQREKREAEAARAEADRLKEIARLKAQAAALEAAASELETSNDR